MIGRLFEVGGRVSSLLPPALRYGGARLGGLAGYAALPSMRRQALQNYAGILHQPPDSPRVRRLAREAVVGYTKLLADFLMLSQLSRDDVMRMVDWRGWQNIQDALALGRGVVVVTPHFGNWDMAAAAAAARGLKVTAVTDHYGDDDLNARVMAARQRAGVNVVPLSVSAGRAVLAALRRNEVVALVCDLAKDGRNVRVRVCGQEAMVPAGPATLALSSGAPVVPITCRRQQDNRYLLEVQPAIEFAPAGDRDADVRGLSQAIMDRFEPELQRYPEQWYLFSPMWMNPARPASDDRGPAAGAGEGLLTPG
ncbi:MAG: phosphatidylinositol dimannoside acyltransferase [Chloroflexota bacterium]|jgi:KDO2-lipid IV(A) lauroyltransferase|nr:phosphatidylinositol dimannoside acyltransferase [Chloroflexota bacterium]